MGDNGRGYTIQGRFYPHVPVDEWKQRDFRLAREMTGMTLADLFGGKVDAITIKAALSAVAFRHGHPQVPLEQLAETLDELKPAEIVERGFDEPAGEAAPDPPDSAGETPASSSSADSAASPASSPES